MEVKLILGDCLEVMKSMPDKSVDAVFTSPPYNMGKPKYGSMYGNDQGKILEYSLYDDDMPEEEYKLWQNDILRECHRIVRENGVIYYNHKPRILNGIYNNRRDLIPFEIRQEIVWDTNTKINFNGLYFVPHTERIFIIAKGDWRPQKQCVEYGDFWKINPDRLGIHPAMFPLALAKRAVLSATSEGMTVLDPFAGSGTTGVACVQTGRNFIGIEIDPTYFAIAEKRISEAQLQDRLF